jgi:hypothetical protein
MLQIHRLLVFGQALGAGGLIRAEFGETFLARP